MTKELHCADAGFDCQAVIRGESDDDVMTQAAAHAQSAHGVQLDDETAQKVRTLIHEAH